MSCKSAIYTADPSSTVLTLSTAAGTAIPLGTTVRRFGCNAVLSGNGVLLKDQGYFDVDASVTFTPTAAGAYTVTLFKDGGAVPGATQTVTAAGMIYELVQDVDDECEYADRLALKLNAVDYDMQVIVPMQHELHEKYKKKLHDIGKKLS